MGLIGFIQSFVRTKRGSATITDIKCDPGGGANVTAQNFSAPGDDSPPLPGDYCSLVDGPRSGTYNVAGFVDPKDEQLAEGGEKRLYSRNAAGEVVATIWLKKDGTIHSFNEIGNHVIDPDGTISIFNDKGSYIIKPDGQITTANDVATQNISAAGTITTTTGPLTKTESASGTFSVVNGGGSFSLSAAGVFTVNGATIATTGAIVSPVSVAAPSVLAAGTEVVGHVHNEKDLAPLPCGPMIAG